MAVATAEVLSILEGGKANLEDLKANEGNKEIARENGVSIMDTETVQQLLSIG